MWPVGHMESAGPEHKSHDGKLLWTVLLTTITWGWACGHTEDSNDYRAHCVRYHLRTSHMSLLGPSWHPQIHNDKTMGHWSACSKPLSSAASGFSWTLGSFARYFWKGNLERVRASALLKRLPLHLPTVVQEGTNGGILQAPWKTLCNLARKCFQVSDPASQLMTAIVSHVWLFASDSGDSVLLI